MTEKIISDDGSFHTEDEAVDLSTTTTEGWVALAFFWILGATVLYQFVTRYVFNDSAAWPAPKSKAAASWRWPNRTTWGA